MDFGDLRAALHASPCPEAWCALCALFEEITEEGELARALDYALPHLDQHWSSTLRVLPARWYRGLLGQHRFRQKQHQPEDDALEHPHIEQLARLVKNLSPEAQQIHMYGGEWFELIDRAGFEWVEQLSMYGDQREARDSHAVTRLIATGSLAHLDMRGVFSARGLRAREFFEDVCPERGQLRSLDLTLNSLSTEDIAPLLPIENLVGLTRLGVPRNNLDDAFIPRLLAAPLSSQLKHLAIYKNPLGARALEALATPGALPELRTLDVRGLPLSEEAGQRLEDRGVQVIRVDYDTDIRATLYHLDKFVREELILGPEGSVGRRLGNDIVIPHGNISRRHMLILREGDAIFIEDSMSTGGIFVNGRKINRRARVWPDDNIYLGDHTIRLEPARPPTP